MVDYLGFIIWKFALQIRFRFTKGTKFITATVHLLFRQQEPRVSIGLSAVALVQDLVKFIQWYFPLFSDVIPGKS